MRRLANSVFEITAVLVMGVAIFTYWRYYTSQAFTYFEREEDISSVLEEKFGWVAEYL